MSKFERDTDAGAGEDGKEIDATRRSWLLRGLPLGGLLIIGGFLFFGVRPRIITDPDQVRQVQEEIASIVPFPELQPQRALILRLPFARRPTRSWALFREPKGNAFLMLVDVGTPYPKGGWFDQGKVQQSVEKVLQGQGLSTHLPSAQKVETVTEMRDGAPLTFSVSYGPVRAGGEAYVQVFGAFPGKRSMAVLIFRGAVKQYDPSRVRALIDSAIASD